MDCLSLELLGCLFSSARKCKQVSFEEHTVPITKATGIRVEVSRCTLVLTLTITLWSNLELATERKDEKLQNLDEDMIDDLVGDDDDDNQAKLAKEKQAKARAQVERRLAAEQRKAEKDTKSTGKKKGKGDDDDDDDDLAAFVKGSRESKQKKR